MYHNTEISWDKFNYIFSGRTEYAFEQLAYIIFCHEFNQETGIFRYFNQAGIETEPINNGKETIGFQAKYYDSSTKLSSKVHEFTRMVDTAKKKNPGLTKIYVYVNKEFSESSSKNKKKPKYQEDIEDYAISQNVIIEWRVPSHIERVLFSADISPFIRDFFFNPDQGIRKFTEQVKLHTITLIDSIDNSIVYKEKKIRIDYSESIFTDFLQSENKHLVVHGYSGAGKSGIIKTFYENYYSKMPVFMFKATDFSFNSISEFSHQFGDSTVTEFLSAFNDIKHKIIIIDSAEKRFSMTQTVLESFLNIAVDHNWKIIHTIRSLYKDNYLNYILKTKEYLEHQMNLVSFNKIDNLLEQCNIPVPLDTKLRDLICNLFYLNLYINTFDDNVDYFESRSLFLKHIWDYKVKGIPYCTNSDTIIREQIIFDMLKTILSESPYYNTSKSEVENLILEGLRSDEIIDYDNVYKGYYFAHDIYEELAAWHFINNQYHYNQYNELEFHNSLDINMHMRKHYRSWIHDKLSEDEDTELNMFILKSITNQSINKIWKDELLIALMESQKNNSSLSLLNDLFDDDLELLKRAIFLINTTCKVIDYDAASTVLTSAEIDSGISQLYRFTKPSGVGWKYIIDYIHKNLCNLKWDVGLITLVYDIVSSWIKDFKKGTTTAQAGEIALYIYKLFENDRLKHQVDRDLMKKLSITILESSFELEDSLLPIFNDAIENGMNHTNIHFTLIEELLGNTSNSYIPCQVMPEIVVKICCSFWKQNNNKQSDYLSFNSVAAVENAFGLSKKTHYIYYPTSALWTPVFMLLQFSPKIGIDFVIDFTNIVTKNYEISNMNKEYLETYPITFMLSDGTRINQICSSRLWNLHRGGSSGPNLLECILMALEKWLLNVIPSMDTKQANSLCQYLLRNSQSVAITSVINSIVLAHPKKLFETACSLVSLGEVIFSLDNHRLVFESSSNWFRGLPNNKYYNQERINTNDLPFRKTTLEQVIFNYQVMSGDITPQQHAKRLEKLYANLDLLNDRITPENTTLRYALNRIDLRRFKAKLESKSTKDGKEYVVLEADEDEDLKLLREENQKHTEKCYQFLSVSLWAKAKFNGDEDQIQKYDIYETNPLKAFEEMVQIQGNIEQNFKYDYITRSAPIYISAILLQFYESNLLPEQKEYCKEILLNNLNLLITSNTVDDFTDGTHAIVGSLSYLIKNAIDQDERFYLDVMFLFTILLDYSDNKIYHKFFSNTMWKNCPNEAESILKMLVSIQPDFTKWATKNTNTSIKKFIESHYSLLYEYYNDSNQLINHNFSLLDNDYILSISMLMNITNGQHWNIIKEVSPSAWKNIFEDDYSKRNNRNINYGLEASYIKWLAQYTYNTTGVIRIDLLETLKQYFCLSRQTENFLSSILIEHDAKKNNQVFWEIWNGIYPQIIKLYTPYRESVKKNKNEFYMLDEIVSTYCFAWPYWGEKQNQWFGIKTSHLSFFENIVNDLGFLPITLYSISRFINTIGYSYVLEGLKWISKLISENDHLVHCRLQINTMYYLEEIALRVSREYKNQIKKNPFFRDHLLCMLNFLVLRGSTAGFFIREELF